MRRYALLGSWVIAASLLVGTPPAHAANKQDPNFMHGLGQTIAGLTFELPKTVLDATLANPPVVGTVAGLLAGTARALQVTVAGVVEMATAFKPFGGSARKWPQ